MLSLSSPSTRIFCEVRALVDGDQGGGMEGREVKDEQEGWSEGRRVGCRREG